MATPLTTTAIILLALILFQVGLIVGWVLTRDSEVTTNSKLKTMVAIVVTLGWLAATIAGILTPDYTVSPMLHALMGAIVGYFFTQDGISFNLGGK